MLNKKLVSSYISPLAPVPTSLIPGGSIKNKIRCCLFDIYGTLFISGAGDISISPKISNLKSGQIPELDKLMEQFKIKKTLSDLHKDLSNEIKKKHAELKNQGIDYPEVEIDRIWMNVLGSDNQEIAYKFAELFELIINPVYPMPNLEKLLTACSDSGITMGIISNAQFYTPHLFNWFLGSDPEGLGFNPDLILYSYKFGCAKPSERLFQIAAARLNNMEITEKSVLYVGNDMLNDIVPAKRTGFKTALFAGDKRSLRLRKDEPECKNIKPDIVITDLAQLIDRLKLGS